MAAKRARKSLSILEKQSIIAEAEKFRGKKNALAKALGLPTSTLASILKRKNAIEETATRFGHQANKRKVVKASPYGDIEDALFTWYTQHRETNGAISGTLLRSKALELAGELGVANFTASNGWIDRFKKRHGLSYSSIARGLRTSEERIVEEWLKNVPALVRKYPAEDIFSLDETVLFYNLLPDREKNLKAEIEKEQIDQVTVVLCCNSNGTEKLQPVVVLSHEENHSSSVVCQTNETSLMTEDIFESYVRNLDDKMAGEDRKIILFLDHCPAHMNVVLKNVKLQFLPADFTNRLQPMELGITRYFKYNYRSMLVKSALLEQEEDSRTRKVVTSEIDVADALSLISSAWNTVSASSIQNCFYEAGIGDIACEELFEYNLSNEGQEDDDVFYSLGISPQGVQDYIDCDKDVSVYCVNPSKTDGGASLRKYASGVSRSEESSSNAFMESDNFVVAQMKIECSSDAPSPEGSSVAPEYTSVVTSLNDSFGVVTPHIDNTQVVSYRNDSPGFASPGKSCVPQENENSAGSAGNFGIQTFLFHEALKGLQAVQLYVASHRNQENLLCSVKKLESSLYDLHKTDQGSASD